MRRTILILCACIALQAGPALSAEPVPACVAAAVPHAALVGEGRMRYMMMDLYDARLYAPDGDARPAGPLALSLTYLRHLSGARIADSTVEEIRSQGFGDEVRLAGWHEMLLDIFPDVDDGTTLTGVLAADGTTRFYRGDELIGRIDDPTFGRLFFAIWLSPNTSSPDLRAELLNHTG